MSPSTRTITFSQFATEFMNTEGIPIRMFWSIHWSNVMYSSEGVWFKDGEEFTDWGEIDSVMADVVAIGNDTGLAAASQDPTLQRYTFVTHAA